MRFSFTTLLIGCLTLVVQTTQPTLSAESAKVDLRVNDTREPISPYIYGQFIEHLGRCIYGGIWAEMLEDRKFYFPVKDEFKPWKTFTDDSYWKGGDFEVLTGSPWRVIGGKNIVRMDETNPYAGKHSPVITLPGGEPVGIEQGRLAVRSGKTYTGRAMLAGDPSAGPVTIELAWGEGDDQRTAAVLPRLDREYRTFPFSLKASGDSDHAVLRITSTGKGELRVGAVSLMPSDNVEGFRPDVLQLLRELNSPVYRWPGGNFVSGYDWTDGLGERDRRPPRKNPAWTGVEANDVGIHEFMRLCELLDTEPYIAVNTGLGSIKHAADEIEYCNGSPDTPMGAWRAANGHPEPYAVKWWGVGNEMFGNWQLGHMPLSEYVKKHNACVDAMRAVDPDAVLVAVGEAGDWSRTMMSQCADHMDLISEHRYWRDKPDLVEHVEQPMKGIQDIVDAHRQYRKEIDGLAEKDIRIALDEWNYWYGRYVYGELGVQYHLQDALGIAEGLHAMYRNSDMIYMANYAQTVNVIGAIKTSRTEACFDTTGLALKMYREHFGEIPFEVGGVPAPLDAAAAWTKDRSAITLSLVNPSTDTVTLELNSGVKLEPQGKAWTIAGDDKMAYNQPGEKPGVVIREATITLDQNKIIIHPMSATIFHFNVLH